MDNIKQEIASVWNTSPETYDNQYAHGIKSKEEEKQWKIFLKSISKDSPSEILDVGTGTGFLAVFLAELGHNCTGIDLSSGMMEIAKKKACDKGLNIHFDIWDAENLPYHDNTFDMVINRHLLWTIPHPEGSLKEWIRVLKPGGKLVIIDGDWFYKNPWYSVQIFLGKLLIAVTEFRNPWDTHGDYSSEIKKNLPMIQDKNARNLYAMVKDTTLTDVIVKELTDIDKVEKEAMPLKYRLANPHKRICITGLKKG